MLYNFVLLISIIKWTMSCFICTDFVIISFLKVRSLKSEVLIRNIMNIKILIPLKSWIWLIMNESCNKINVKMWQATTLCFVFISWTNLQETQVCSTHKNLPIRFWRLLNLCKIILLMSVVLFLLNLFVLSFCFHHSQIGWYGNFVGDKSRGKLTVFYIW